MCVLLVIIICTMVSRHVQRRAFVWAFQQKKTFLFKIVLYLIKKSKFVS